jgi:hypothetical protein
VEKAGTCGTDPLLARVAEDNGGLPEASSRDLFSCLTQAIAIIPAVVSQKYKPGETDTEIFVEPRFHVHRSEQVRKW